MPVKPTICRCYAAKGVTAGEYAVLLGLILVLSAGGLQLLGGSISTLLGGATKKASSSNLMHLVGSSGKAAAVAPAAATLGLKGSGYYALQINPTTGQPELTMIDGATATASNVSSIDGSRMNTLGSTMLAQGLEEVAAQQTDPALRDYYGQMAKLSYYLAGAEGELDDVPGLQLDIGEKDKVYTKGDALMDIARYSQTLDEMMNNPPKTLVQTEYMQAMPLAVDAYNIAHQYQNAFSRFMAADGKVPENFGVSQLCRVGGCPTGNGNPGSALQYASTATTGLEGLAKMIKQPYDHLVSYDQIRAVADEVLATNKVDNLPVASTIHDAQALHGMSNTDTANTEPVAPTASASSPDTAPRTNTTDWNWNTSTTNNTSGGQTQRTNWDQSWGGKG